MTICIEVEDIIFYVVASLMKKLIKFEMMATVELPDVTYPGWK